jgi:hypothetical protein
MSVAMALSLADAAPDETFGSEDRQVALAFVTEAFAEAVLAGVEGECFAHAAMFAALQELVAAYGEESVVAFAERLPSRVRSGEFSAASRH